MRFAVCVLVMLLAGFVTAPVAKALSPGGIVNFDAGDHLSWGLPPGEYLLFVAAGEEGAYLDLGWMGVHDDVRFSEWGPNGTGFVRVSVEDNRSSALQVLSGSGRLVIAEEAFSGDAERTAATWTWRTSGALDVDECRVLYVGPHRLFRNSADLGGLLVGLGHNVSFGAYWPPLSRAEGDFHPESPYGGTRPFTEFIWDPIFLRACHTRIRDAPPAVYEVQLLLPADGPPEPAPASRAESPAPGAVVVGALGATLALARRRE